MSGLDAEVDREMGMDTIVLVSDTKKEFKVEKAYTVTSDLIRNALEDKSATSIHIPGVEDRSLEKLVEWMKLRKGVAIERREKIESPDLRLACDEKDKPSAQFIIDECKHRTNFYSLMRDANKIGMKDFIVFCCAQLATLLKFASTDDMDRVLDPAITDGTLLPMRESVLKARKEEKIRKDAEFKARKEKKMIKVKLEFAKRRAEMKKNRGLKNGDAKK